MYLVEDSFRLLTETFFRKYILIEQYSYNDSPSNYLEYVVCVPLIGHAQLSICKNGVNAL